MLITEYYRSLPHRQPVGACFFVTFNLKGAIPKDVFDRLQEEKRLALHRIAEQGEGVEQLYAEHKRYFARVDHFLDTCPSGPDWLKLPEIAGIIRAKLHQYDTHYYELLAYCVMSNHVHMVVNLAFQLDTMQPDEAITEQNYIPLYTAMKRIKGGSALLANRLLNRTGSFWQPESYDHYVRNADELNRIVNYVLQNPVKAGLVTNWQAWPHTYLSEQYR